MLEDRPARIVRLPCDVDRAIRELTGHPRATDAPGTHECSPEPPELRSYPVPPAGGVAYTLCNGHLRDVFEAVAPPRHPTAPAPGSTVA
jgi:hypothetical protein